MIIIIASSSKDKSADTVKPLLPHSVEIGSTEYFFLRFQNYGTCRKTLMDDLNNTNRSLFTVKSGKLVGAITY